MEHTAVYPYLEVLLTNIKKLTLDTKDNYGTIDLKGTMLRERNLKRLHAVLFLLYIIIQMILYKNATGESLVIHLFWVLIVVFTQSYA